MWGKKIVEENPVNPADYDQMSVLLDELIEMRRQKAIECQEYLVKIGEVAQKVTQSTDRSNYPNDINVGKQALFENFGKDVELTLKIDQTIQSNKLATWVGDHAKEKILIRELSQALGTQDNDEFKAFMDVHVPDWKQRKALLKDQLLNDF